MSDSRKDFRWLYKAAFEAALIVFAVMLGFLVTEWREDAREREQAEAAIARIAQELDSNIAQLEAVIPYHRERLTTVEAYIAEIEAGERPAEGIFFSEFIQVANQGLYPPQLNRSAWDYAVARGVLDPVDFDVVEGIAAVYSIQETGVNNTWQLMASTILINEEAMTERALTPRMRLLGLSFQELGSQEDFLLYLSRQARQSISDWQGGEHEAGVGDG